VYSCKEENEDKKSVLYGTSVVDASWNYGEKSYKYAEDIVGFGPRPVESEGLEKTRQYITNTLEELGWSVQRQAFVADTPQGKKQFVNLFARFKGNESLDVVWSRKHKGVLAAHIDSKKIPNIEFVGAADAATSVGMVMEIAELVGKNFSEETKYLELVFFDGEEALNPNIVYGQKGVPQDGLYGSYYYAKNRNLKRNFGILLNLLGVKGNKVKIPIDNNGVLDIIGDFSSNEWWHTSKDTMDIISKEELGKTLKVVLDLLIGELRR